MKNPLKKKKKNHKNQKIRWKNIVKKKMKKGIIFKKNNVSHIIFLLRFRANPFICAMTWSEISMFTTSLYPSSYISSLNSKKK